MRDPTFRQKRSERMWKSEGLFAEAKQNHYLSRAKYRGRPKVQIQAYLSAMVQNLKRLVALFSCWLLNRWRCKHVKPPAGKPQRSCPTTFSTRPYDFLRLAACVTRVEF